MKDGFVQTRHGRVHYLEQGIDDSALFAKEVTRLLSVAEKQPVTAQ